MLSRPTVAGALAALFVLAPVSAPAAGLLNEWGGPADVAIELVSDIAPAPGLEGLGVEASTGRRVLFSLQDGSTLDVLPSLFDSPDAYYLLRDVDEDGLAEIIAVVDPRAGDPSGLGVIDFVAGKFQVLHDLEFSSPPTSIEVVRFTAQGPLNLVISTVYLTVVGALDGQVEYDSASSIGGSWQLLTSVINDFDGDSEPEILATFRNISTLQGQTLLLGAGTPATSVSPDASSTLSAVLGQNMPNPSSGSTEISFRLNEAEPVKLRVFDAAGRVVRTLVDDVRGAGAHRLVWDGRDDSGSAVGSGVYFYELAVPGERVGRKMMVIR